MTGLQVLNLVDRWSTCLLPVGFRTQKSVREGVYLKQEAVIRDARRLFDRLSVWYTEELGRTHADHATTEFARAAAEALGTFPKLAQRCDQRLTALRGEGRVLDSWVVISAAYAVVDKAFGATMIALGRLASACDRLPRRDEGGDEHPQAVAGGIV